MAKTKPNKQDRQAKKSLKENGHVNPQETPEQLYALALELVERSEPQAALQQAQRLWLQVQNHSVSQALPALHLLGEICVELGDTDAARAYFEQAVKLDPEGVVQGPLAGGSEKFLWLAQLCEEGGKQSVLWFEKGAKALHHEIAALESGHVPELDEETLLLMRVEKKRKLANALCGIVEVYMTDLSWEDDAEQRCESVITQAMTVEDETSPEVLQTLASVRLSQERKEDAQSALKRSLESWRSLDPEDDRIPNFPTRISLARLLMEAELETEAMDVIEHLTQEDDQSVEAWYLGGWCQHLIAEKHRSTSGTGSEAMADPKQRKLVLGILNGARKWLEMCLKLYKQQDYEDDRLKAHAEELVEELIGVLGPSEADKAGEHREGSDSDEWEGIEDDAEDDAEDNAEDKDEDEEMMDTGLTTP